MKDAQDHEPQTGLTGESRDVGAVDIAATPLRRHSRLPGRRTVGPCHVGPSPAGTAGKEP